MRAAPGAARCRSCTACGSQGCVAQRARFKFTLNNKLVPAAACTLANMCGVNLPSLLVCSTTLLLQPLARHQSFDTAWQHSPHTHSVSFMTSASRTASRSPMRGATDRRKRPTSSASAARASIWERGRRARDKRVHFTVQPEAPSTQVLRHGTNLPLPHTSSLLIPKPA